jgi:hypothetical protein
MRFIIGHPPDDPDFAPEQETGWQKLREMGPATLLIVGSLAGVPLAALFSYAWSRVPGTGLSFSFDVMTLGRWAAVLFPLLVIVTLATFLASLIFVHELIHVLACPRFGLTSATVLGVWPSRVLAYGNHSGPVSFTRGIVVGLAPFLVLSVLPLLVAFGGGPRWPLVAVVSVVNALVCGGDAVICLMLVCQVPFNATLRNEGWDTWWRPAEHQDGQPERR